ELEAGGDSLGLAALLGADARVGAGGVDEAEERDAELIGHAHEPLRLAVALGAGHAEVAVEVLLGVAALLLAEHDQRAAVEAGEAADDRRVVAEAAIAAEFDEVGEDLADVVEGVGTIGVLGELELLPRGEGGEALALELVGLLLEPGDLGGHLD